jgi:hypothetical protein
MSKHEELGQLADKIESNYADRHAIAEAVRVIAGELDRKADKPDADLVDTATDKPAADLVDTATDKPAEA